MYTCTVYACLIQQQLANAHIYILPILPMPLPLPPYIGERPGLLVGLCSSSGLAGFLVSKQKYHNKYDCKGTLFM